MSYPFGTPLKVIITSNSTFLGNARVLFKFIALLVLSRVYLPCFFADKRPMTPCASLMKNEVASTKYLPFLVSLITKPLSIDLAKACSTDFFSSILSVIAL